MPGPASATSSTTDQSSSGRICTRTRAARRAPLRRVVEQVEHGPFQRGGVARSASTARASGRTRRHRPAAAPAPAPACTTSVSSSGSCTTMRRVLAGQLDQVADQRGQLGDLGLHVVEDLGAVGRRAASARPAAGRGEQLQVGAHRGQRGAQLVPGVGDEPALLFLGRGERAEHLVEAVRSAGPARRSRRPGSGAGHRWPRPARWPRSAGRPGRSPARATATPASAATTTPIAADDRQRHPELGEHLLGRRPAAGRSPAPARARPARPPPGTARRPRRRCGPRTLASPAATASSSAPSGGADAAPSAELARPFASSRASRMSPAPSTSVGMLASCCGSASSLCAAAVRALQQVGVERLRGC